MKIDDYRKRLASLQNWEPFLLKNSGLPGPRGNIELGQAVADEGDGKLFLQLIAYDAKIAPAASGKGGVIAVVSKQARVGTQRDHLLASDLMHSCNSIGVPHVQPWHSGGGAHVQYRRKGCGRIAAALHCPVVAPTANRREIPGSQSLQGCSGPLI